MKNEALNKIIKNIHFDDFYEPIMPMVTVPYCPVLENHRIPIIEPPPRGLRDTLRMALMMEPKNTLICIPRVLAINIALPDMISDKLLPKDK